MNSELKFDDIRPFDDQEVAQVLSSLLQDKEFLIFLAKQTTPKIAGLLSGFIAKRLSKKLKSNLQHVDSISALQHQLRPYISDLINQTCDEVSISGLQQLDPKQTYVFISNHRDIIMDPLILNHALLQHGFNSCRIAIGDNLLKKPFIAKLMRLNKSFVVKRSVEGSRKKLAAMSALSAYIHQSIKSQHSVWLAQQSGRSKDGQDYTDTAILKMLHLAGKKLGWDFNASMNTLNLVPVSISYEWDPCDVDKAREVVCTKQGKAYQKKTDEDLHSMLKGLKQSKGRVAIHFSQPLKLQSNQAQHWCDAIDNAMHEHYKIFDSQYLALDAIKPDQVHSQLSDAKNIKRWKKRLRGLPLAVKQQLILNYAQPYFLKQNALATEDKSATNKEL